MAFLATSSLLMQVLVLVFVLPAFTGAQDLYCGDQNCYDGKNGSLI